MSPRIGWRSAFAALRQFIVLLLGGCAMSAMADDTITLQLKWRHAFQFAGYYAAIEHGYYREAGLDVRLRQAEPNDDPLKQVLDGNAQYGVGNSSLLLARRAGQPVVVLAVMFQHSPLVLITRQFGPTQAIHDLAGKRLMIEPQSDELLAYLKQEGIPLDGLKTTPHSFSPQDLIAGKVDAISAYVTNEPYALERAGFSHHLYTPRSVGIDFYGDNLFTTEQELKRHPDRVKAFRAASLRGWAYAMAHPREVAELIVAKYAPQLTPEFLRFEAERMAPLFRTDLIEIGYSNPGRWRHIADTYAELGLLPRQYPLDGFLYDAHRGRDLTWFYIAGALLPLISAAALYVNRVNRRLTQALAASREAQERLRISEQQHRLLADNAADVIWIMNLQGRLTYISPSVQRLRGYTSDEVLQQPMAQSVTAGSLATATKLLGDSLAAMAAGRALATFRAEIEQHCKDGSTVWSDITTTAMQDASGSFVGILGVSRDISTRRRMEEQIRQLAFHDPLTGLPNRRLLNDRLGQTLAASQRSGHFGALCFLDLDNFKPLNDSHGHHAGDQLLSAAAQRLKSAVRAMDTVARYGGDEFVVLVGDLALDRDAATELAAALADKLRTAMCQPYQLLIQRDGQAAAAVTHHCTVSIGVALLRHGEAEPDAIIKAADAAMYLAKAAGRNQINLHAAANPHRRAG